MQNWQPNNQFPGYGSQSGPSYGTPAFPPYMTPPGGYGAPNYMHYPAESRYEYAGFWRRFVACYILDAIFVTLLVLPGYIVAATSSTFRTNNHDDSWGPWFALMNTYGIPLLYHTFFTVRGGTPGYRILGLRVTGYRGQPPNLVAAVLRQFPIAITLTISAIVQFGMTVNESWRDSNNLGLGFLLLGISGLAAVVWFFGCFTVIGDPHKQALHDKVANTYVIHQRY